MELQDFMWDLHIDRLYRVGTDISLHSYRDSHINGIADKENSSLHYAAKSIPLRASSQQMSRFHVPPHGTTPPHPPSTHYEPQTSNTNSSYPTSHLSPH
jgi:hypothetical protein